MQHDSQSIGMMQGAFFVPKGQLLSWVNQLLQLQVTRVQQLGTGAVYCNILDAMFPNKIPMQRVNWKAKNEWEFINNLKILQTGFAKCYIHKHIEIQRLAKSKYQDNLQFIQWLKRYFDLHNTNDLTHYDPQAARKYADVDFSFIEAREIRKDRQEGHWARKEKHQFEEL